VDLVLALVLAAGSTVGAQLGARVSRYLRGDQLLIILASLALLVVGKMLLDLVTAPSAMLDVSKSHARLEAPSPPAPQRWELGAFELILPGLPAAGGGPLQMKLVLRGVPCA
jgi:hypothetical protein